MRVLMVIAPVGGTSEPPVWAQRQIDSLVRLGIDISTFVFHDRRSIRGLIQGGRALRRMAQERKADLLHVHYGAAQALIVTLFSPKPVIVSFCGSDLFGNYDPVGRKTWSGMLSRALSQFAAVGAGRCIAKSEELQRSLWLRWLRNRCEVIPNGVDLEMFRPMPQAEARARLGWMHQDPVVLFMDRKNAWVKDPNLARAAYDYAKKFVTRLRLRVLEHESPDKMPLFFNAADALLLTSRHEGSNNTLKEALACNLPVVATVCGDTEERVQGVRFTHVCAREPRVLGQRLAEIATARQRSNGRQHVHHLDQNHIAQRIEKLYDDVLSSSHNRSSVIQSLLRFR